MNADAVMVVIAAARARFESKNPAKTDAVSTAHLLAPLRGGGEQRANEDRGNGHRRAKENQKSRKRPRLFCTSTPRHTVVMWRSRCDATSVVRNDRYGKAEAHHCIGRQGHS
jgi:hypothetical protein